MTPSFGKKNRPKTNNSISNFNQAQHPIINVQTPFMIQAQPLVINPIQKLNTPIIDPTIDDDDNSNLKMKNEKKEVKT